MFFIDFVSRLNTSILLISFAAYSLSMAKGLLVNLISHRKAVPVENLRTDRSLNDCVTYFRIHLGAFDGGLEK